MEANEAAKEEKEKTDEMNDKNNDNNLNIPNKNNNDNFNVLSEIEEDKVKETKSIQFEEGQGGPGGGPGGEENLKNDFEKFSPKDQVDQDSGDHLVGQQQQDESQRSGSWSNMNKKSSVLSHSSSGSSAVTVSSEKSGSRQLDKYISDEYGLCEHYHDILKLEEEHKNTKGSQGGFTIMHLAAKRNNAQLIQHLYDNEETKPYLQHVDDFGRKPIDVCNVKKKDSVAPLLERLMREVPEIPEMQKKQEEIHEKNKLEKAEAKKKKRASVNSAGTTGSIIDEILNNPNIVVD